VLPRNLMQNLDGRIEQDPSRIAAVVEPAADAVADEGGQVPVERRPAELFRSLTPVIVVPVATRCGSIVRRNASRLSATPERS
jgi:hypothetical protein